MVVIKYEDMPQSDKEEVVVRVAKIHRRASTVYGVMTPNVDVVDGGDLSDLVEAVSQTTFVHAGSGLAQAMADNPADLIFRLLSCGMKLQELITEDHQCIQNLKAELNASCPAGFKNLLVAANKIYESDTPEQIQALVDSPLVQEIYKKMEDEMGG